MAVQGYNMTRLSKDQLDNKLNFIFKYAKASNAADGSTFDPNSNVTSKNVATMAGEINKDINIQIKRELVYRTLKEIFGSTVADLYIEQLEKHEIYTHDETTIAPYCVAVSMYPFLQRGLQDFGGDSKAPKHLSSFNGSFINLIFALSSQFCGAVATVEYLMCFDHFAKRDYGNDYLYTHEKEIKQELQQVVYALNQPASARNYQSPFWNISIFDKYYFDALFGNFYFPDGDKADWTSLDKLQKYFMQWFNKERTKALLTFPVVTVSMLIDKESEEPLDRDYESFIANELANGNSFFIYMSKSADSLSSCCRLQNNIADQLNDFSYSLGAGGVMTGSINVITLNINRFIQDCMDKQKPDLKTYDFGILKEKLSRQIRRMHMYQYGFRKLFEWFEAQGLMPAYTGKFITLDKQYVTIGINGLVEAAEFLGYEPSNNKEYKDFISFILKTISDENKKSSKEFNIKINTEFVPAENLGVKFAKWDRKDGYFVPRDCYNSYFYPVEDEDLTILDKFVLHGIDTTKYLDGGSALHLNLEDYPDMETCRKILRVASKTGCPYFCTNVRVTVCNECGYINKETKDHCTKCGSRNVDYATRVIG